MGKCQSCGSESEYKCEKCEQYVCDNCTVPFTQTNQIDYTLCNECYDMAQERLAEEQYVNSLTRSELIEYYKTKRIIKHVLTAVEKKLASIIKK